MNLSVRKYLVFISIGFYLLLFVSTYHLYKLRFDVDGIGPMVITDRLLNHEWYKSINGIWSPLNSWLVVPLLSFFKNKIFAFKLLNLFASTGIIITVHGLLNQLFVVKTTRQLVLTMGLSFSLPIILLSHTHYQLSGDILQLFFVLVYINLVLQQDFLVSIRKNMLAGFIIAAAAYAKAYNLPFLIVTHFVVYLIGMYVEGRKSNRSVLSKLKPLFFTYSVVAVFVAPWIALIHYKYKIWAFSIVHKFNFHWMLNSQSYTTLKTDNLLIAPPYTNSLTTWEDPFLSYHSFTGPFDSITTFLQFLKNISHNIKIYFVTLNELSFLAILILSYWFYAIFIKGNRNFQYLVAFFMSLFVAAGYLMIYIEVRYIWLAGILLLILGIVLIDEITVKVKSKLLYAMCYIVFFVSFLLTPVDKLQDMRMVGKDLQDANTFLKLNNISGNFTAIFSQSDQGSWCDELAFISGSRFFLLRNPKYSEYELYQSIIQNDINFLLYFYTNPIEEEKILQTFLPKSKNKVYKLVDENCIVIVLNK